MIFVDSSIIIAYFAKQDSNHLEVLSLLEKILSTEHERLITSSDVIIESLNWVAKRCTKNELITVASILIEQELIDIQDLNQLDWIEALGIIKKYHDQKLSFTDAASFAMIQRLKIKRIISLDSDFNLLRSVINLAQGCQYQSKNPKPIPRDYSDLTGLVKDLPPDNYSEK